MKRLFFGVSLFLFFHAQAMETGAAPRNEFEGFLDGLDANSLEIQRLIPESPKKPTLYSGGFDCVTAVIDSVNRLESGDEWIGAWYTVTDKNFVEAACGAVLKGAQVTVYVDCYTMSSLCTGGKEALEALSKGGVKLYIFNPVGRKTSLKDRLVLHTKMALIVKKLSGKKSIIQGSANLTKAAYTVNDEMITYFPDDAKAYDTLKEFVENTIAPSSKEYVVCLAMADDAPAMLKSIDVGTEFIKTPEKGSRAVITSSQHDIHNILCQRIENTGKNGEIIVHTMTLSSYAIIKSLIAAAKKGVRVSMLFDGKNAENLPKNFLDHLTNLLETKNAQIFVSRKIEGLQHAKSIAIMRSPQEYILATGTGNLVHKNDAMLNIWTVQSLSKNDDFMAVKKLFEKQKRSDNVMPFEDFKRLILLKNPGNGSDAPTGFVPKKIKL